MAKRKTCSEKNYALMAIIAVAAFILGFLVANSYDADARTYYDGDSNNVIMHPVAYPVYDIYGNSYWAPVQEGYLHGAAMYDGYMGDTYMEDVLYDDYSNSYIDYPEGTPSYDMNSNSYWK